MKYYLLALLMLMMTVMNFGYVNITCKHSWKYCEYAWDSQEQRKAAEDSGNYNPKMCLFENLIKADNGKVFITTTKEFGPGAPATLSTLCNETGESGSPLLCPYPDWSWHNNSWTDNDSMCNKIFSVHRLEIKCNHLFVLDNGISGPKQVCNPKLMIFDLTNDKLIKTIYIPIDIATNQTNVGLLVKPIVYVPEGCSQFLNKMIVFMADMNGFGLVVYNLYKKSMCRVESDYMKPTDTYFSIANYNFTYTVGLYNLVIVNEDLYYSSITSKMVYKIKIETLLKCPNKEQTTEDSKVAIQLPSQAGSLALLGHTLIYDDSHGLSILGTDVSSKHDRNTVLLVHDPWIIRAVTAIGVSDASGKTYFLTNNFERFATGPLNLTEYNFHYCEMNSSDILEEMNSSIA